MPSITDKVDLKIPRKLLETALKRVAPFSGKTGNTRYGLLRCNAGLLEITCTSGECWGKQTIKLEDGEFPDMCVEASTLLSLVSLSNADQARFTTDGSGCILNLGRSRYTIRTAKSNNFHMPSGVLGEGKLLGKSGDIKEAVSSVHFASEQDSQTRWETGILLEAKAGKLDVVAASGQRNVLSHRKLHGVDPELECYVVAPRGELLKAINGLPDDVDVFLQSKRNQIILEAGAFSAWITLLDVKFPDWKRPLFKEGETTIKCLGVDLQRAIKAATIVAGQQAGKASFVVRLKATSAGLQVVASGECGDTLDEFDAEVKGEPATLPFSVRNINEAIGAAGNGNVTIQLQGKLVGKGAIFTSEEKPGWLCVIHQVHD